MLPENPPSLSIVIPAFNEELRLPSTLQVLAGYLEGKNAEVIVVVEKSVDSTLAIARDFSASHLSFRVLGYEPQRGKGFAVKTGMLAAEGAIIFFMDADLSVPVTTVDSFLDAFRNDPTLDVLVGNRQHAQSEIVAAQGWIRRSMGQTFNRLIRSISGIPLRDTQCGFKAFRREAAKELFGVLTIEGFAFDVEIFLLAKQRGFRLEDRPVEWKNSPASKVHIFHDSLRMLGDVWKLK